MSTVALPALLRPPSDCWFISQRLCPTALINLADLVPCATMPAEGGFDSMCAPGEYVYEREWCVCLRLYCVVDQCTQHSIDRAQCAAECSFTAVTGGIHAIMVIRFKAACASKNGPNKGPDALTDAHNAGRLHSTRSTSYGRARK